MNRQFRESLGPAAIFCLVVGLLLVSLKLGAEQLSEGVDLLPKEGGGSAGFLTGVIHGCLLLASAIAMTFDSTIALYQQQPGASSYTLGYLLGAATVGLWIVRTVVNLFVSAVVALAIEAWSFLRN